jgi:squalene-hopene/tetraprenyl-beta-curcumene cyclase
MTSAYTKLAVAAQSFPWSFVDALPFELALAPRSVMGALRLPVVSYALPALVCVGLSRHAKAPSWFPPIRWWREHIADQALDAILKMQPESGGYLEASPITAFCLIGLKAAGRGDHAVARNALRFLISTQRDDGSWPVEVNLSVWNTTRAIDALAAAGLLETALTERERATTRDWLLGQQCTVRSVYSDTQPGGWGWNHLSGSVPDVDDTSGAIIALRHLGVDENHKAIIRGRRWLTDIQNRDGGFPTFCRGWNKLPFDKSAPDLTAHALRACSTKQDLATALTYLSRAQNADGSFAPLWFGCESEAGARNLTYGTSSALLAFSLPYTGPLQAIRNRALQWLVSIQNRDGGFGGCASAPSTAEETGLALRALVAQGYTLDDAECQRAAQWLMERQRADGSWDPAPIGFYFAVLWYYEELYPLYYALGGLGALAKTRHGIEAATAA